MGVVGKKTTLVTIFF